jgi:hypothetical protein
MAAASGLAGVAQKSLAVIFWCRSRIFVKGRNDRQRVSRLVKEAARDESDVAKASEVTIAKTGVQMNTHHDSLQMEFAKDGFNNDMVLQFVQFTFTRNSLAAVIFSRSPL